jgi:aminopeptidase N
MYRTCAVVLAACFVFLAGCVTGRPVVTHHDLAVRLYPKSNSLAAEDTLTVHTSGQSSLAFVLSENATVEKVATREKDLPFTFEGGALRVALPPDPPGEEELSLTVSYRASFRDHVPEDPVNTEDPSYGVQATIREDGTFLSDSAGWYPEIPGSRPTFRIRVDGPAGYEAVTAGRLARRKTEGRVTQSEWETRMPLGGLSLSAGPYRVREETAGETKLYTYFYPGSDALSESYLAAAARYLALYRELFGPYPFEKFAVVENFFPTGYGFPSYTLLGSTVVRLPFIVETSLGHEVAHSWWGNGVRVDYQKGNWSEGLTTYVADYLYKERGSVEEGREYRRKMLRDYATLVTPGEDFPLRAFTGRDSPASRAVGYGKGAMVFHMARRFAGEDAFWKGMRDVVREKMFREASWDDFGRALGRETGTDFAPFFRQWVDRPGAPVIALGGIVAEEDGGSWNIRGQIVQKEPYFDLRVPLQLVTEGCTVDTVLTVADGTTSFSLSADARPRRLVVDPDVDLFRRLDPTEIPPTVNGIRGSTDLLVVAARGLPADILEASKLLLTAMGKETFVTHREEDTPPSLLTGHDVLFLGLPDGNGYLPKLPGELSVSRGAFALGGKTFTSLEDSLFVVLSHPSDGDRVAALFLALSPEAAKRSARKIPHYGKYSYLAFAGGKNKEKGTWEVTASPTVHVFPSQSGRGHSPTGEFLVE